MSCLDLRTLLQRLYEMSTTGFNTCPQTVTDKVLNCSCNGGMV